MSSAKCVLVRRLAYIATGEIINIQDQLILVRLGYVFRRNKYAMLGLIMLTYNLSLGYILSHPLVPSTSNWRLNEEKFRLLSSCPLVPLMIRTSGWRLGDTKP